MTKTTSEDGATNSSWNGYFRCDDLVPPLCDDDLKIKKHQVETIEGVMVTYWRYTPSKLKSNKLPMIVINGGPGLPHNFVRPTRSLACDGREIVMYDQAGTGESVLPGESDDDQPLDPMLVDELLTIEYYTQIELPAILKDLGWDRYHILAESWGTMIAFEFATNSHKSSPPKGLGSLILNAPIADNHKFIEYQWDPVDGSIGLLPIYLQERLLYYNRTQDFENPEFQELEETVMSNFNARIGVQVDCWMETERAGISSLDYANLTGTNDLFYPPDSVRMKGWSVLQNLYKLQNRVPIQLNYGGYDFVRPRLIADTAAAVGGNAVECHVLPRAGHSVLLDSPTQVYANIRSFLQRVEATDRGFYANGTCPIWNEREHRIEPTEGTHFVIFGTPRQRSSAEVVVLVLVSLGLAYLFGVRVGRRRNKKFLHGYEQVVEVEALHPHY